MQYKFELSATNSDGDKVPALSLTGTVAFGEITRFSDFTCLFSIPDKHVNQEYHYRSTMTHLLHEFTVISNAELITLSTIDLAKAWTDAELCGHTRYNLAVNIDGVVITVIITPVELENIELPVIPKAVVFEKTATPEKKPMLKKRPTKKGI